MSKLELPIDRTLPQILAALEPEGASATIASPPGSGKTTRVPPALAARLRERTPDASRVLVLEPRRIAARAAARRVASECAAEVGREVGYEVRDDRRVSKDTQVAFLTEGILVQRLMRDPFLEGVGAVILDEFHERHVDTDLALAMLREVRDTVRPDLRIVVMSATLEVEPIAVFLEPCERLVAEGQLFEVQVEHERLATGDRLEERVARAVKRALHETRGDILVFLPGMAEIRRSLRDLEGVARAQDLEVLPLHGSLEPAQQDAAIQPGSRRKVVLSTNIAESSVTIEGVTAVVDSGLARVMRHDVGRGVDALRVERISRASAVQRTGRAGRTGPGTCYRLWSLAEERGLRDQDSPEIRRVDLASPSLTVRKFAGRDPAEFGWFEAPERSALDRADELLRSLSFVDPMTGRLTDAGDTASALPVHPRFGAMLLEARRRGCVESAAELAALLTERDGRGRGPRSVDVRDALAAFQDAEHRRFGRDACAAAGLDPGSARSVVRSRDRMIRVVRRSGGGGGGPQRRESSEDPDQLPYAVVAGFPDRVATLRGPESERVGQLASGRGIVLRDLAFADVDLCVALQVEDRAGGASSHHDPGSRSSVRLALPIERSMLDEVFPEDVADETVAEFAPGGDRVRVVQRVRFHALVLEEKRGGGVAADPAAVEELLALEVRRDPFRHLGDQKALRALLARAAWLRGAAPDLELPLWDEAAVGEAAAQLAPGKRTLREFREAPVLDLLEAGLTRQQRSLLRSEAPPTLRLPSGRELKIEYPKPVVDAADGGASPGSDRGDGEDTSSTGQPHPHIAARLQEFFGMRDTPRVAGGRVPLTLHLLAPNRRPVQITRDLASFWDTVYPSVRTELRNRYPRHAWPEDPRTAEPDRPGRRRRK